MGGPFPACIFRECAISLQALEVNIACHRNPSMENSWQAIQFKRGSGKAHVLGYLPRYFSGAASNLALHPLAQK